jgi:transposase
MSRKVVIKEYHQGQVILFPESLESYIPEDAPVRLVNQVVDQLDISEVLASYKGGGSSCYSPRMLLKVLFYAYMNNVYSCRKIEKQMKENIHYMWLSGKQFPKYNTINNFRSHHLKNTINKLFTQVVLLLVDMGYITLQEQYVDGTKMESRANKYTFVWRKSVEKYKARLEEKIKGILKEIEKGIAMDNQPGDDDPGPINSEELQKRIEKINRENKIKTEAQKKKLKDLTNKHLPKLREYEHKLAKCGKRNSYSKTDPDATFMRMKEDAMKNGQLKPAYNLQIATENQFITNLDLYPNPTDTLTLIPFLQLHKSRYGKHSKICCADSGYGSEENYAFLEENHITPFVKYNYFHKEQKKSFIKNPFLVANLYYNAEKDYYVCPIGQHMTLLSKTIRTTENGYTSVINKYQAQNCEGCPLRGQCHKSQSNRIIQVSHKLREYRKKAKNLLTSDMGLYHRSRRPIEPEAVFGQMKQNKMYKRFRHFGKDKVLMDMTIFAIAFNIAKLFSQQFSLLFSQIYRLYKAIFSQNKPYQNNIEQKQSNIYLHRKIIFKQAA